MYSLQSLLCVSVQSFSSHITAQSGVRNQPPTDSLGEDRWKGIKILGVLPAACKGVGTGIVGEEAACLDAVQSACRGDAASSECVRVVLSSSQACRNMASNPGGGSSPIDLYMGAFRRALPELQGQGWRDFTLEDESSEDLAAALHEADVVIATASFLQQQHLLRNTAYVIVDDVTSATLSYTATALPLEDAAVLGVLKPAVLRPARLQRGPLRDGQAHLAALEQALSRTSQSFAYETRFLSDAALAKVVPLVPQLYSWAHPFECGALSFQAMQFQGVLSNKAAQKLTPLAERPYDVYLAGLPADSNTLQQEQHARALKEVRALQAANPHLNVLAGTELRDYDLHIGLLSRSKIFVSTYGEEGEVSRHDYEAWLSGSILVKPGAATIAAYPDIYSPNATLLTVAPNYSDLRRTVLRALADLGAAGALADSALEMLRQHADPARFAAAFSAWLQGPLELWQASLAMQRLGTLVDELKTSLVSGITDPISGEQTVGASGEEAASEVDAHLDTDKEDAVEEEIWGQRGESRVELLGLVRPMSAQAKARRSKVTIAVERKMGSLLEELHKMLNKQSDGAQHATQ